MTTTKPATKWPEPRNVASTPPDTAAPDSTNASRTPKPRVLARFPDLDAPEPPAAPAESVADWESRIVNQTLARRIVVGVAVALVLAAVVPLAFQRQGNSDGGDTAAAAKPAWQPDNPAPDASMAPAWNAEATQVGERVQPREETALRPGPPVGQDAPADPRAHPSRLADEYATGNPGAPDRVADAAAQAAWNPENAVTVNRGQSLVPPGDAGMAGNRTDYSERPTWSESDRGYPHATSAANREAAMPAAHASSGNYHDQYPPARPETPYQRGYGSGGHADPSAAYGSAGWDHSRSASPTEYREPVPSYQPYRNDSPAAAWQEPAYRHTEANAGQPRGYAAQPAYDPRAGVDSRHAPQGHDYRSAPVGDYRSAPAADYRSAPVADYRSAPAADYRAERHPLNDRYAPQEPTSPGYQPGSTYGHDTGAHQPAPGYYDGRGAHTAPGRAAPSYQADRRYDPGAANVYGAQPGEARFQGTIEQPPADARYDHSGSRLY